MHRIFALLVTVASALPVFTQEPIDAENTSTFKAMKYRSIGPYRGGRSAAVTGVPGKPQLFYFGSTGGGVWRTSDAGGTWHCISDGYFGGSIGAITVSESDPNVIYVGGGEKTVRGNVSSGSGMWKSTDAGKTWKSSGLEDSRHISRIRVHPRNADLVYVAAMGHLSGPNKQRGVYRSKDGGVTWQQILFVNDEVGAVDLLLDPNNPRIIYASTWRIKRTPYSLESGGPGSGLWKSTDGGDTWKDITKSKGLPKTTVGIIGVTVSPVDSNRVWAIIEAEDGGVFRSDDAGANWTKTSEDRSLRQRAWYYTRIYAHPRNLDEVFIVNVGFMRSADGGKNFQSIRTPHGDHHDLWIDPNEPQRMIVGDDGGAQVSINAGAAWSTYHNQPTAQFYRVTTDNHFPYRIYGAQQDNSTVRIASRSDGGSIGESDWEATAGGESGHIAVDPKDNDIVYGGSYGGFLMRINHRTKESRIINVWPDNPIGHGAADLKYRFQWNFPIFFSPHDAKTLYACGNVLFKTTNDGQTWEPISPDLTTNDKSKQGPSGGPITKDNTSVEYYCTIFAALESPHEKGVLWCGSDDGVLQLSRNGGKSWDKVTPPDLPPFSMINSLEAHPTEKGGLYLAATCYKLDDLKPYLYKTTDYGKTWTRIVNGIKDDHFSRVIRADAKRPGLLYAGTENGMYLSFDDGAKWQPFQLNLPIVPITDLTIKNDDLIVATQGRSFWVLDDLTPLHQWKQEIADQLLHVYKPRTTLRLPGGGGFGDEDAAQARTEGQNPPNGAVIYYQLKDVSDATKLFTLEILDGKGNRIRKWNSAAEKPPEKIEPKAGMNRLVWNLRYPDAEGFPGMILWGSLTGPKAMPGMYQVRIRHGDAEQSSIFEVKPDPRSSAKPEDYRVQFDFLISVRDKLTSTHTAIKQIRDVREQIVGIGKRIKDLPDTSDVAELGKVIEKKLTQIEETLYQTKAKSSQDVLNYPIRLNNKLASLAGNVGVGDNPPPDSAIQLKDELVKQIDAELTALKQVVGEDVKRFNELLTQKKVPNVFTENADKKPK
ncbi:MAG TPA: hypothetical protein PLN21_08645 [Gemmatales bacterium]|nr:hypothetical protein [Gemmatales bacterium]